MPQTIVVDGRGLTLESVVAVARHGARVSIPVEVQSRMAVTRAVVDRAADGSDPVYGINTGFGKLASVRIPADRLQTLQRNLIVSHASGFGDPLPVEIVRGLMLLRINVLTMPTSGVRPEVALGLGEMLNAGIHPVVPEQGSVGASGDLAPLSHVAQGLLGEGEVDRWDPASPEGPVRQSAADALAAAGLTPVILEAKEGLALINGTQAHTATLALAVADALRLWQWAHAAAALSLEVLKGTPAPFDARLHAVRPHPGQVASAALLRDLLAGSEIRESHRSGDPRVQDAYCLRCTPQIMGAVHDALDHARRVVDVELNSATDNPLVVGKEIVSGGNFHGQPVALVADFVSIALTSLAGLAERRLERMLNPDLSGGLPAFLAVDPGLESGFMMLQIAAASVVGECRTLAAPASIHSVPTDANQEDVVPMAMTAALKARRMVANARYVVAAELMCGAQGLEYHRPLRSSPAVERVYERIRTLVPALTGDRSMTADVERLAAHLQEENVP